MTNAKTFEGVVDSGYDAGEFPHFLSKKDSKSSLDYDFINYIITLSGKHIRVTIEEVDEIDFFPPLKPFITTVLYRGNPLKILFEARAMKCQGIDFLSLSDIDHLINRITRHLDSVDSTTHANDD